MKKISYILFSVLLMFVSVNCINADDDVLGDLMVKYEASCKSVGRIMQLEQDYNDKVTIEVYKYSGGNYIRVNGKNLRPDDEEQNPPKICGYEYGTVQTLNFGTLLSELDLLISDVQTKQEAPSIRILRVNGYAGGHVSRAEYDTGNLEIEDELVVKPTIAPGSPSYKPPVSEEKPDELFSCYYKYYGGDTTDTAKLTYNKTKNTVVLSENSYDPFFSPDRIRGNLVNMLKSGSCPSKIKLCNTYISGEMYFSDQCPTSSAVEYSIVNYDGEFIPSEEYMNSDRYKELLGGLKVPLALFAPEVLSHKLTIDAKLVVLSDIPGNNTICEASNCKEPEYKAKIAIRKIKAYCQDLNKFNYVNSERPEKRIAECESFEEFYNKLLQDGVISNIAEGCGILTSDLKDKVIMVLDIIKIAGPVLALVLGMLDFTKAVVASDADKEMKAAGKKFITRLMAAALLFLIPALLGVVLRPVLGDKMGGDLYCEIFRE